MVLSSQVMLTGSQDNNQLRYNRTRTSKHSGSVSSQVTTMVSSLILITYKIPKKEQMCVESTMKSISTLHKALGRWGDLHILKGHAYDIHSNK
jgi:hypothetical protein